jgi:AraC family transcriptional regulator
MTRAQAVLHAIHGVRQQSEGAASLRRLAAGTAWSPSHFHRVFTAAVGETPKHYTLRLRLERAAARLASTEATVLSVALDAGFASHEVFTRACARA